MKKIKPVPKKIMMDKSFGVGVNDCTEPLKGHGQKNENILYARNY